MVETVYSKIAPWITATGPEAAIALFSQGSLVRNLADFPFPTTCSENERRSVEARLLSVLESHHLLQCGHYRSSLELDSLEAAFLAERRLIPFDFFKGRSHGGVYIADDQSMSIVINGLNHLCMTVNAPGLNFQEIWARLNSLDDLFASSVDFAFSKNYGYLTATLSHVGTGLKMSAVLHLPALMSGEQAPEQVRKFRERRQILYGLKPVATPATPEGSTGEGFYYDLTESLYAEFHEAVGDLYLLTNQATLGVGEEEIVFHLRQTAGDMIAKEKALRGRMMHAERVRVEDRVGRALGIARNARLLGYAEGTGILSSVRLGVDLGLVDGLGIQRLNELLFASQGAHVKMKKGHDCDEWTLSLERANLFRARLGHERKGL